MADLPEEAGLRLFTERTVFGRRLNYSRRDLRHIFRNLL
jgi:hypothetical protein